METANTRLIPLSKGKSTLVDAADYDFLMQWKWHVNDIGYAVRSAENGYKNGKRLRKLYSISRVLLNAPPGMFVDHINHDTLDNRRCNLRLCTKAENNRNCVKRKGVTSSQYKGVVYDKQHKKWVVRIKDGDKYRHIGRYKTEIEAATAYNDAAAKYYTTFAYPNIIKEVA